ncbi:MAG: hypothetical protein KF805_09830 [Phycisphaeraceae bacterium]|nr:hypothetical protein [Phycisphaeraceae bacterium]
MSSRIALRRISLVCAISVCGFAFAAPTVTLLPSGEFVSSLSYDGTSACGNIVWDGSYETFRWTPSGGNVRLGLDTVIPIGRGSGTPDISYNGNQVSASILSSDFQLTQGLWDINGGWTETMPPPPADGALVDDGYGSAWGLSGNGLTVTGFYWNAGYRAIASSWTAAGGVVALGQTAGRSARANSVNYNGTIACGWEETETGSWMPRAWRDGVKYELDNRDGGVNTAEGLNGDGSIIVGSSQDEDQALNVATIWRWNGSDYVTDQVGALPDTPAFFGQAILLSVTNDGTIAVGVNQYSWGNTEGMVWTQGTGLISASAYFAMVGVVLPDGYSIADCYNVSADGSTINATIIDNETFNYYSAIIRLRQPCPGDLNNDGQVDDSDFVSFAAQYDALDCADPAMPGYCRADINNDGVVEDADFVLFAQAYDQLVCP